MDNIYNDRATCHLYGQEAPLSNTVSAGLVSWLRLFADFCGQEDRPKPTEEQVPMMQCL